MPKCQRTSDHGMFILSAPTTVRQPLCTISPSNQIFTPPRQPPSPSPPPHPPHLHPRTYSRSQDHVSDGSWMSPDDGGVCDVRTMKWPVMGAYRHQLAPSPPHSPPPSSSSSSASSSSSSSLSEYVSSDLRQENNTGAICDVCS
eukprot:538187-Pyramimonas_sp.AAC.1